MGLSKITAQWRRRHQRSEGGGGEAAPRLPLWRPARILLSGLRPHSAHPRHIHQVRRRREARRSAPRSSSHPSPALSCFGSRSRHRFLLDVFVLLFVGMGSSSCSGKTTAKLFFSRRPPPPPSSCRFLNPAKPTPSLHCDVS